MSIKTLQRSQTSRAGELQRYDEAVEYFNLIEGVIVMNISSKTCLITGANSGLGLATTK